MSSRPTTSPRSDRILFALACANFALLAILALSASVLPSPQRLLAALPLWLLLPFVLVGRHKRLWIVVGASVPALLLALGATYHRPRPGSIRVATLTVFHGARGPERIGDALRRLNADIICLQDAMGSARLPDPVPAIQAALPGYQFVRKDSFVIASRHPITRVTPLALGADRLRGVALTAEIALPSGPVEVATTRRGKGLIATQGANVDARIEAVAAWAETRRGPTLVCGDFLTPLDAAERQRLVGKDLADAFATAGSGFGWTSPDRLPLVRVDYILAGRGLTPVACWTLPGGLSDHRAVVADLARP